MDRADILALIVHGLKDEIISPHVDLNATDVGNLTLNDMELDSLDLLQFTIKLEEKIGIELEADQFPSGATLAEIADFILQLRNN